MRASFGRPLNVDANEAHDIKLELDRRSQELIESLLLARFPDHAIYGEEGMRGDPNSEFQWVIDPIDGTVNFFLRGSAFCDLDRTAPRRQDHHRRDLRSHARRTLGGRGRRCADIERPAHRSEHAHESR